MADDRPTFGSLFAGIGGIDLGLERAGWRGRWQVEWDPFCQRVLAKHWPDIQRYGDITTVDWSGVERVDLLAGGFPCQPVSGAGRQKAQSDERWLWPEFHRAIRALRPRLVLVENVTNLMAVNGGSAFGDVIGDLAASGYNAEWDCIPASAVGALHERDRVWIVAYPDNGGWHGRTGELGSGRRSEPTDGGIPLANPNDPRLQGFASSVLPERQGPNGHRGASGLLADADGSRLEEPRSVYAGLSLGPSRAIESFEEWWATEPDVGRVAHGVPSRVDRLRSLGNAVVPQVVEVIGRQLLASIERAA